MTGPNQNQRNSLADKNRRQIKNEWIGLGLIFLIGAALCLIEALSRWLG